MDISLNFNASTHSSQQAVLISAFSKTTTGKKAETTLANSHWPKEYKEAFNYMNASAGFLGKDGETFTFALADGTSCIAWDLVTNLN